MARRGDALREHILDTAKASFLEAGFDRTSMDAIAARAETSKRSLYAHFPTKEALFLGVIDRVGVLFGGRMRSPRDYADDPTDAVSLYCARFLQMISWDYVVQSCRLGITVAPHFPEAARLLHEVFFARTTAALADYLTSAFDLAEADARSLAGDVMGATVNPRLERLLFGVDAPRVDVPEMERIGDDVDLPSVRRVVVDLLPAYDR